MNTLLDAEADGICRARRYERSPERADVRADHFERRLWTKANEERNMWALAAIGIETDGYHHIPGLAEGDTEDRAGWLGCLRRLKDRGLNRVQVIVSDAYMGLVAAAVEVFTDARHPLVHHLEIGGHETGNACRQRALDRLVQMETGHHHPRPAGGAS